MKDVTEIRRLNLNKMVLKHGTQVVLAEIIELSPARVNHLLTGQRNIGEKAARKIEQLLNKPYGWMDLVENESNGNNKNIVDISKYSEDQQRVVRMLLDSFDASKTPKITENNTNKTLTTPTKNVGGGG
jgi:plasmid maintenance system antidote protein VapI